MEMTKKKLIENIGISDLSPYGHLWNFQTILESAKREITPLQIVFAHRLFVLFFRILLIFDRLWFLNTKRGQVFMPSIVGHFVMALT